VADDVTLGELHRRLQDHEVRTDRIHGEQDNRIARVAAEAVPLDVYQSDQRAVAELARRLEQDRVEDVRKLREDIIKPLADRMTASEAAQAARPGMTFGRWMTVLGVVAAFLGVIVAAWALAKGA
jgi:CHASE3 domain sensor protein